MEIADLIVVNKYDNEFKITCKALKRKLESALSLTMSKHMLGVPTLSGDRLLPKKQWHCPVELVSAEENVNVDAIWQHALDFQEHMGTDYFTRRRQIQMQRGMWRFLGEAIMSSLHENSDHKYA
jgi:putative protein kinase ArgK-like GTPase of G3E family